MFMVGNAFSDSTPAVVFLGPGLSSLALKECDKGLGFRGFVSAEDRLNFCSSTASDDPEAAEPVC
jgi:hypothetical protein